jgi:nicotinamidase-related amidase
MPVMPSSLFSRAATLLAAAAVGLAPVIGLSAGTLMEDWDKVQLPPRPQVGPVQIAARTTALLILDFTKQACSERVPRCLAVVPSVENLMQAARAAGAFIVYSRQPGAAEADIDARLSPRPGDPVVAAGPNKFLGTELGKMLKDKGIDTVIVTGVRANGAVLFTGSDAALNGYNVVVPLDGMASLSAYEEQFTAFNLVNAPGMQKVKLTTADAISFR